MGRMDRGESADRSVRINEHKSARFYQYSEYLMRLLIAAAFAYAGWSKLGDPVNFADSIASFGLLPRAAIIPFALALPLYEIVAAAMLLADRPRRLGALALLVVTVVFCAALAQALMRGLDINCGCFGPALTPTSPSIDLLRDIVIAAACVFLYWRAGVRTAGALTAPQSERVYTGASDK